MTFFFLVVGLEAKRELDRAQLRERRRLAIPVLAALGGMAVPVAIYLAFNAGGSGAHGWGAAMSTDTAFALGVLALVAPRRHAPARAAAHAGGRRRPRRADRDRDGLHRARRRSSRSRSPSRCSRRCSRCASRRPRGADGPPCCSASRVWVALLESGIDPVIAGLAVGLITSAYPPARVDLERVVELTRSFREQPTPELARSAQRGVAVGDLAQRAPPVPPAPVDELRDRAAVRARQRRHPRRRRAARRRDVARRSRSASSSATWSASRSASSAPPGSPARLRARPLRLALSWPVLAGGGDRRRHRLHRLAADLEHRLRRPRARGGQARRARRRGASPSLIAWAVVPPDRAPARPRARAPARRAPRRRSLDLSEDVDPARDHVRGSDAGARHARRVRRLRVPVLRAGGGRHPRAAGLLRRRPPLRLAPPAAQRRPPERPDGGRGGRGGGRAGRVLGDPRPAADPPGRADADGPRPPRRGRSASTSTASGTSFAATSTPSGSPRTWRARTPAAWPARPRFFINGKRHEGAYDVQTLTAAVDGGGAARTADGPGGVTALQHLRSPRLFHAAGAQPKGGTVQRRTRVVLSAVAVATLALPAPAAAQAEPKTKTFIAKRPAEAMLDVRALAPGDRLGPRRAASRRSCAIELDGRYNQDVVALRRRAAVRLPRLARAGPARPPHGRSRASTARSPPAGATGAACRRCSPLASRRDRARAALLADRLRPRPARDPRARTRTTTPTCRCWPTTSSARTPRATP